MADTKELKKVENKPKEKYPKEKPVNGLAVAGLVFAILGGLLGIILSPIGFVQCKDNPEKFSKSSKGIALAGIIISCVEIVISIFYWIFAK